MTEQTPLFHVILGVLISSYMLERGLAYLNATYFSKPIPEPLKDLYNREEYKKSQAYKRVNYKVSFVLSTVMMLVTILFMVFGGFDFIDKISRGYSTGPIGCGLLFFGMITLGNTLISFPFSYYSTFVVEEKFGFNKSTKKLFFTDFVKKLLLKFIFGGLVLYLLMFLYGILQQNFWIWAWAVVFIFMLLINMFYSHFIVPIFNKQKPLESGTLQEEIQRYCGKVGFRLNNVFVMDGSKRSSKANAYFSGFGKTKRIVLFDTLIKTLSVEEIVAVLAHEVGHYKHRHIIINIIASFITIGVTFFLLSICLKYPEMSYALKVSEPSFHIGLLSFAILYSPISAVLNFFMHLLSRRFEYQADRYAKDTYRSEHLIAALFKLSKESLSNLSPHPIYVSVYYSHPTLLQRTQRLRSDI